MSRQRWSDYVHVRAMRLLVFVMIAAIALVAPFAGSAAPSTRSVVTRDSFSGPRTAPGGLPTTAAGTGRPVTRARSPSPAARAASCSGGRTPTRTSTSCAPRSATRSCGSASGCPGSRTAAVWRCPRSSAATASRISIGLGSASRATGPSGWPCSGSATVSSGPSALRSACAACGSHPRGHWPSVRASMARTRWGSGHASGRPARSSPRAGSSSGATRAQP